MDTKVNFSIVEYQGQRVLTTEQLAQAYECDVVNIRNNFKNNKKRFEEGKHYFKLTGEEFTKFKAQFIKNDPQNLQAENIDPQNLQVKDIYSQNAKSENADL